MFTAPNWMPTGANIFFSFQKSYFGGIKVFFFRGEPDKMYTLENSYLPCANEGTGAREWEEWELLHTHSHLKLFSDISMYKRDITCSAD